MDLTRWSCQNHKIDPTLKEKTICAFWGAHHITFNRSNPSNLPIVTRSKPISVRVDTQILCWQVMVVKTTYCFIYATVYLYLTRFGKIVKPDGWMSTDNSINQELYLVQIRYRSTTIIIITICVESPPETLYRCFLGPQHKSADTNINPGSYLMQFHFRSPVFSCGNNQFLEIYPP